MITLEQVAISYGDKSILREVNARFETGSFTSIIGVNGSGKSTLLKTIAGLHPYRGNIYLDGKELRSYARKERAKRLAYLPQVRQIPQMDVATLVAHGRFPHLGFAKQLTSRDRRLIDEAVTETNIEALLDRKVTELSGGERQRVYLAMAITQDADAILLDEPTTFLDIHYQLETIEILRKLNRRGRTILMVAHDLQQAFAFADMVCLLHNGTILAAQPPQDLCRSPLLPEVFNVTLTPTPPGSSRALYGYQLNRID